MNEKHKRVKCPNCNNFLSAPARLSGKTGKCPKCGFSVTIPYSTSKRAAVKLDSQGRIVLRKRWLVYVLGGIGLLVAGILYFIYSTYYPSKPNYTGSNYDGIVYFSFIFAGLGFFLRGIFNLFLMETIILHEKTLTINIRGNTVVEMPIDSISKQNWLYIPFSIDIIGGLLNIFRGGLYIKYMSMSREKKFRIDGLPNQKEFMDYLKRINKDNIPIAALSSSKHVWFLFEGDYYLYATKSKEDICSQSEDSSANAKITVLENDKITLKNLSDITIKFEKEKLVKDQEIIAPELVTVHSLNATQ